MGRCMKKARGELEVIKKMLAVDQSKAIQEAIKDVYHMFCNGSKYQTKSQCM